MLRLLFVAALSVLMVCEQAWARDQGAEAADAGGASGAPTESDSYDAQCTYGAATAPLLLMDAVGRALCENPKTRAAWATIKLETATVTISKEGYLPSLGGAAKELRGSTQTRLSQSPSLDTSASAWYSSGSLSLSWVLFDFGQRGDQLEYARQLLAAARANLDLSLQEVFLQTAADYYDAQAAEANLRSTQEIDELTAQSVNAAQMRVDRGVAPVSDVLQAQTAHAQAVINRVNTEEEFRAKRGALAVDMGMAPDEVITLPEATDEVNTRGTFTESLHELIEEAKRDHPSVIAAARALAAAKADESAARIRGFPTVSVVAGINYSNRPLTPSLGSPSVPGSITDRALGVQIDVPLSDALWKRGLIAKAHAQAQAQEEALKATEQQVAQDVWDRYIALQADTDNVANAAMLVESAEKSVQSTQRRYDGGAGSILELLSSQSAYASAQEQRIRALSNWRIARLALAESLGRLDMAWIREAR